MYLSPEERLIAPTLYKSLRAGAEAIRKGMTDIQAVQGAMAEIVKREPALTIDYLAVCDSLTLEPLSSVASRAVLLGAVRLGRVRLIDNLVIAAPSKRTI
jgi:pantoate--beta-alanine ligase